MDAKLKQSLLLFKKYCQTFGLKPTVNKELLDRWEDARGSMTAATFCPEGSANDLPPVAWVSPDGDIYMEHDENIIGLDEPAVALVEHALIEVAINNKQAIHPTELE